MVHLRMNILNQADFTKHVLGQYPMEAVGYIHNSTYFPLENIHDNPTEKFKLSFADSLKLAELTTYTLIHSHTQESFTIDPRTPSLEDMIGQRDSDVLWGIVHCDGENVSNVLYFGLPNETPLIGRNYISNVYDCFTIARDFYYTNYGFDIGSHPRPAEWQEWNPYYIQETYASIGFRDVELGDIQRGDVLLFAIGSNIVNHIGIYLQDDIFIHHLYNRTSAEDSLTKWRRQLIKVIRYVNS